MERTLADRLTNTLITLGKLLREADSLRENYPEYRKALGFIYSDLKSAEVKLTEATLDATRNELKKIREKK